MAATERLKDFPVKATPTNADILFVGDASNGFIEVQSTIGSIFTGYSPALASIAGLTTTADQILYTTAPDTYAVTSITGFGRNLVSQADASSTQTLLGLTIGGTVQAHSNALDSIAALTTAADLMIYTTGSNIYQTTSLTAFGRTLVGSANAAAVTSAIGALPLAGGTMTGPLVLAADPAAPLQPVTLQYLQAALINDHPAALVATAIDLPTWTYNNGTAGVGATLTAPANGASTFDGVVPTNGQRILVVNQTTNPAWQGIYTIVQGTGGTPTVLTRASDYNTAAQINPGDIVTVISGTAYAATQWMMVQTNPITVGTTAITFRQQSDTGALLKANNLSDLANTTTARANLGVAIGTNVQAFSAALTSIAGLTTAADQMIYTTAPNTYAATALTAFSVGFLASANTSVARSNIGLSNAIINMNIQGFATSGTYTPTAGTKWIIVDVVGGGGGSGGCVSTASANNGGGGGGAANIVRAKLTIAQIGASATITVGAGGTAGGGGGTGGAGGGTTFAPAAGGSIVANGGSGGVGINIGTPGLNPIGGTGGIISGTTAGQVLFNVPGESGDYGWATGTTMTCPSGKGGSGLYGAGGKSVTGGGSTTGNPGLGNGSGASGGTSVGTGSSNGAAGSNGLVVIWEFISN